MTVVSIHQPCFFPYLGVFYKILKSDRFVFLDDAQYTKSYCFEWNRIKTPNGECRFKIPISYRFGDGLNKILYSSCINTNSKKEQKVIDICKILKADEYLSGKGAMNYQKEEHFLQNGIKLTYTDFKAKPYNQNFGEFRPNMSVLDFLFNEGYNKEKILEMS